MAGRNLERGKRATQGLTSAGYKVAFVQCNVSQEWDITNLVETAVKTFGRLDVMVNNAGIYPMKPITEMDTETWDRVLDIE
jgi:NAD(P)-dependent dehydrogenase (short-subunit alcohol dehydrogenase family)